MGYRTAVLDPDPLSPAGLVSHEHIRADYLDPHGLDRLGERCAAITTEFENVPAAALARLAQRRPVAPSAAAVAVCQDRAAEKAAFARSGVACAPHAAIATRARPRSRRRRAPARHPEDRAPRLRRQGPAPGRRPRRAGRGLRGARRRAVRAREAPAARRRDQRRSSPATRDGEVVHLPVQDNVHARRHPRRHARAGAPGSSPRRRRPRRSRWPTRLARALDYVGVLCVEFFVLADGSLVANEMAPRPHNSGHYSIDACDLSQFELQVRAMTGAPLVAPRQHSPCGDAQPARRPLAARRPRRARLAGGARAAGRAPAPLRQGRGAAGPKDGPPDAHRGERRRGRGDAPAPRRAGSASPWRSRRARGSTRCGSTASTRRRSTAPPR